MQDSRKKIKDTREEISKAIVKQIVKAKEWGCFPEGTAVALSNGEKISIESLGTNFRSTGMKTISSKRKYFGFARTLGNVSKTSFCTFLDKKPNEIFDYLVFDLSNRKKLMVSDGHLIFEFLPIEGVVKAKQAKKFKVGEMLVYAAGLDDEIQTPWITKISSEKHRGAYSPLTSSGTFLANGFLVSSYSDVDSFDLAQASLLPLKLWHRFRLADAIMGSNDGSSSFVSAEGIHPFAKLLMILRESLMSLVPSF